MANHTVLIIDYEPRSIRASTVTLEKHGFVVEVAHDGIAGLKAFEKLSPAMVLIEAMLPKKHGFEVCQEIKKSAHGKATPVVITTGVYRGRKYRSQAIHIYGCDEYLEKPFTEEQLLATCRRFLGDTMPEPSKSEHEPVASPTPGPSPLGKRDVAAEQPKVEQRVQWATGTDGLAGTRGSGFGPIVGDLTEQEITARLDAILPAEIRTHPGEEASTAAIAVEPTPAAPSIGVAEELVSSDAVDLGAFDPPENPRPFERWAGPSADELDNVTAEELAGILEPLEPPAAQETEAAQAPTREPRIVQFDSDRGKKSRRKKRSKKQRREPPRGSAREAPAVDKAREEQRLGEIAAEGLAAEMEDLHEAAAATNVGDVTFAAPAEAIGSEAPLPPEVGEAKAKRGPLWMGIAAVVVVGFGAMLFFMFRDGSSPGKPIATQTERAAGLGSPVPTTRYDDRDRGDPAQDRPDRTQDLPAAPAAVSKSARPLPAGVTPPSGAPTGVSVAHAEPPVEKPVATEPAATVEDRTPGSGGEPSDSENLAAVTGAPPAPEPPPAPAPEAVPEARLDEAPADTDTTASAEPTESEPDPEALQPEPREAAPMTAQGDLVNLHEADLAPAIISHTPPGYPVVARRLRQEGTVVLNVLVNEHGNVVEVEVIRGVTAELDAAAVSAVRSWAYRPAEKDGVAVRVWKPEKVTFKL